MEHPDKSLSPRKHYSVHDVLRYGVLIAYAIVIVTLFLLSASNYPVQWKQQVNYERQRYAEVIMQALSFYVLDRVGEIPGIPEGLMMVANTDACSAACPALGADIPCFNLTEILVPGYMREMLQDPLHLSDVESGFYLMRNGRDVSVGACHVFFGQDVSISREL